MGARTTRCVLVDESRDCAKLQHGSEDGGTLSILGGRHGGEQDLINDILESIVGESIVFV